MRDSGKVDGSAYGAASVPGSVIEIDLTDPVEEEESTPIASEGRSNYGVDSPTVVFTFAAVGLVATVAGIVTAAGQGAVAAIGPFGAAVLCFAACAFMVRSSKVVKPRHWGEQLDRLGLRGSERALDVGCGRGLVAVELAKRLPDGEVVGIDVWRSRHQSGNSRANAERNLRLEGVEDRVEIVDGDALDLPFADGEFDVVTAGLVIHTLALAADRRDAIHEIMRVTKPGGRIVVVDSGKTNEVKAWLAYDEWEDVTRTRPSFRSYPPVRTLTATKPRRRKGAKAAR